MNPQGKQCCVCKYYTGNKPFSHTYMSKECYEYVLEGLTQEEKNMIYKGKNYQNLPEVCGEKKWKKTN